MPQGMLIAAGMDIKSGNINDGHTLDLAPTILAMLNQQIPTAMEDKVLPIFKDYKGELWAKKQLLWAGSISRQMQ